MDKYKIIKVIGTGMFGTTYLAICKKNKKKYALKITKISADEGLSKKGDIDYEHWRQVDFGNKFSNEKHMMDLHDSFITDDCNYKQKINKYSLETNKIKIKELNKSKYCSILVYDLKEGILKDIIGYDKPILKPEILYTMCAQIAYALYIMYKKGYTHGDVHAGNIGYVKTKQKTIKILNYKIPTHGYIFSLIDYGFVNHKKYDQDRMTGPDFKILADDGYDLKKLTYLMSNIEISFRIFKKRVKNFTKADKEIIFEKIKKLPEWDLIKGITRTGFTASYRILTVLNRHAAINLFDEINPEETRDIGISFMDRSDLWFIICNSTKHKNVIKYFANKL